MVEMSFEKSHKWIGGDEEGMGKGRGEDVEETKRRGDCSTARYWWTGDSEALVMLIRNGEWNLGR